MLATRSTDADNLTLTMSCPDHWHCDPQLAPHACTKPDRTAPCPSCRAGTVTPLPLVSKVVTEQERTFGPITTADGSKLTATVRFDDRCGNGHNTLSVTAEVTKRGHWQAGGCQHKLILKHFPELKALVSLHLCSTDGPMHYIENTLYWLGYRGYCDGKPGSPPNIEHARSSACWPDMPEFDCLEMPEDHIIAILESQLPEILTDLRTAVHAIGMRY